ncbi:hypothetical protein BDZ45DRAFT_754822 [Acephala macrosclerotiorum]|nr:hypothetical protein BDZ45DRAFT_754822 [Acephala macrosclerotiorum]
MTWTAGASATFPAHIALPEIGLFSYQRAGINITHPDFLNEPDVSPSYAGMRSNGSQAVDFLKILVPALKSSGFGDRRRRKSTQRILPHGYSSPTTPLHTTLPTWQTEWADLTTPFTSLWDSAPQTTDPDSGEITTTEGTEADGPIWASNIQDGLVNSNTSAFLHWMGAEESSGPDTLIRVNATMNSFTVSKRLWAYANFGRYVKPGSRRVYANSSSTWEDIGVSAFESKEGGGQEWNQRDYCLSAEQRMGKCYC